MEVVDATSTVAATVGPNCDRRRFRYPNRTGNADSSPDTIAGWGMRIETSRTT